jgi:hypothetical protein
VLCRVVHKSKGDGTGNSLESETETQSSYSASQFDPMQQYQYGEQMNFPMFTNTNASYQYATSSNDYTNSSGMQYGDISPMLCADRGPKEGDFGFLLDLGLDGHELLANL